MIDKERILDALDDFKDEYGTSFSSAYTEETDIIEDALELYYEKLKEEKANGKEDAISREAMLNYQQYLHGRMSNEENHKLWEFIKNLPSITHISKKCHNENHDYAECDQFVCSNCGIELQDWHKVERDEDDNDVTYHEYEFNYCPNCGARIGKDAPTTMMSKK